VKAYNTIYTQYKELSQVIYTGFLKLAKIDEKLDNIEKKDKEAIQKIRRQLYLQTIQRFNILKPKYILSINYILPDDTIFLKMINPLSYGKKISEKRKTLASVQKNNKPIDSYEIGKNGAGFRFVYPIKKENKYLGAIGITFSEQAITSALMKQYDVLSNFILKDGHFDKNFLKKTTSYKKAHLEGFLHRVTVINELQKVSNKGISQIKPDEATTKLLYQLGMSKKANSSYINKINKTVTSIPIIHTITNEQEAFLTILSKGETISFLNSNYLTIFFLLIFLYLTIILLFFQQKIKTMLDKVRMEELLQKDKQLLEQAKLAQMGEMIGNIAHQWRQPLSAISTIASGTKLNHEFDMLKDEDIPRNMDLIVQNTKYLSETIDTFRDFIKEDRKKKEILIQEKIDESLKIVKASIENSHIKLIKEIDYESPVLIEMISEEFSQVIINLLNNSKDAIVEKKIEDAWIKISQTSTQDILTVKVEDNAQGIKDEYIHKIFDPYFTTKHQFQGTGLGLYMSKIIIEKHLKGTIEASNSDNGAVFTIKLPIKRNF